MQCVPLEIAQNPRPEVKRSLGTNTAAAIQSHYNDFIICLLTSLGYACVQDPASGEFFRLFEHSLVSLKHKINSQVKTAFKRF